MTPAQEAALVVIWVWAGLLIVSHALSLWEVYRPRPRGERRDTIAARLAAPFWALTARIYGHDGGAATQSEPWAQSEPGDPRGLPLRHSNPAYCRLDAETLSCGTCGAHALGGREGCPLVRL